MFDFTAFDFETANASRSSACALGIARVEDGEIVDSTSILINPEIDYEDWSARTIAVHGITPDDALGADTFEYAYELLNSYIGDDPIVAHNMAFDGHVLDQSCRKYQLPKVRNKRLCTLELSKKFLNEKSYKLDALVESLDLDNGYFLHHDAESDAIAAASLLLKIMELNSLNGIDDLVSKINRNDFLQKQNIYRDTEDSIFDSQLVTASIIDGEKNFSTKSLVSFTGELDHFTRDEAIRLVEMTGAKTRTSGVTMQTTSLIVGKFSPRYKRGKYFTSKALDKALDYRKRKKLPINIILEPEFIGMVGAESATNRTGSLELTSSIKNNSKVALASERVKPSGLERAERSSDKKLCSITDKKLGMELTSGGSINEVSIPERHTVSSYKKHNTDDLDSKYVTRHELERMNAQLRDQINQLAESNRLKPANQSNFMKFETSTVFDSPSWRYSKPYLAFVALLIWIISVGIAFIFSALLSVVIPVDWSVVLVFATFFLGWWPAIHYYKKKRKEWLNYQKNDLVD